MYQRGEVNTTASWSEKYSANSFTECSSEILALFKNITSILCNNIYSRIRVQVIKISCLRLFGSDFSPTILMPRCFRFELPSLLNSMNTCPQIQRLMALNAVNTIWLGRTITYNCQIFKLYFPILVLTKVNILDLSYIENMTVKIELVCTLLGCTKFWYLWK